MRRVMMSGFLMMMGCATVGSVGVNTSNHGIWYQDCGVSRQIPGSTGWSQFIRHDGLSRCEWGGGGSG